MSTKIEELFISFRSDSSQLDRGLQNVERQFNKTVDFIKAKPMAAMAGLSVALIGVATAATKMASDVDEALRRTSAALPGTVSGMQAVRAEVRQLSLESGRSQADLARATEQIAKGGVASTQELAAVLRAGVQAADASGEDLGTVLSGLDQIMDEFHLNASQAQQGLADLFATAQGRAPLVEVLDILQRTAPVAEKTGVSVQQLGAAIVTLKERGEDPRVIVTSLKQLADAGARGTAEILKLAQGAVTGAEAQERLAKAIDAARGSAATQAEILKQQFNTQLIDLGENILPLVTKGLLGLNSVLGLLTGSLKQHELAGAADAIGKIADQVSAVGEDRQLQALKALNDEFLKLAGVKMGVTFGQLTGGSAVTDLTQHLDELGKRLKAMPTDKLETLYEAMRKFSHNPALSPEQLKQWIPVIGTINNELFQRPERPLAGPVASGSPGATGDLIKGWQASDDAVAKLRRGIQGLDADIARAQQGLVTVLQGELASELLKIDQQVQDLLRSVSKVPPAERQQIEAKAAELRSLVTQVQAAKQEIASLEEGRALGVGIFQGVADRIDKADEAAKAFAATVKGNVDAAWDEVLEHLKKIHEKNLAEIEATKDYARTTVQLGRGFTQVLTAAGLLDEHMASIFQNAIATGEAVQEFATDLGNLGKKDDTGKPLTSTLAVLQSALPVLSGLSGLISEVADLFGDSPALKAAKQAIERNTEALDRLRPQGLAGTSISGTDFARLSRLVDTFVTGGLPALYEGRTRVSMAGVQAQLKAFGLTEEDVDRLAKELGLPEVVALTRETIPQFLEFLKQVGAKLKEAQEVPLFGEDVTGRIAANKASFGLFGTSTQDQFATLIQTAITGEGASKAIAEAFKNINLDALEDPAVREAARTALQHLLTEVLSPGFDLSSLGGFDAQGFIGFLSDLMALLSDPKAPASVSALQQAIANLEEGFSVFQNTAAEQAQAFLETIAQFDDRFADLIDGLDLGSAEGLAAAKQRFLDFYTQVKQGAVTLDDETFAIVLQAIGKLTAAVPRVIGDGPSDGLTGLAKVLQDLEESFQVFDPSAAEQAVQFLAALADFSPAIKAALDGLDLTTQAGIQEAIARLKGVYTAVKDGTASLGDAGVTVGELITAIDKLEGVADQTVPALEDLGDRLRMTGDELDALNVQNPGDRLLYVFARIGDVAPAIAEALQGLDLTTQEGLQAADKALADLFFAAEHGAIDVATSDVRTFQNLVRTAFGYLVDQADTFARKIADQNAQAVRDAEEQAREAQAAAEAAAAAAERQRQAEEQARTATGDRALQQLADEFKLFDVSDTVEQLRQLGQALQAGGPVFGQLLGGLDLTDPNGRTTALGRLQQFFLQNPQGVDNGFFSAETTRQQVLALAEALKQANTTQTTGENRSFAVDRSITEVTGDYLASLLGTSVELERNQLEVLQAIRDAIGPAGRTGLVPPAVPGLGGAPVAAGTTVFSLAIYLDGTPVQAPLSTATQANLRQLMQQVASEIALAAQGG